MIFTKGPIWATLKSTAQTAIPKEIAQEKAGFSRLAEWLEQGSITPIGHTASTLNYQCFETEVGYTLFNEAEAFLDHASEHRSSIYRIAQMEACPSDAWLFTTLYYWYFFLALSWTRMQGFTAIYLQKNTAALAIARGGGATKGFGAGSYEFQLNGSLGAGYSEVKLHKSKVSRTHDLIWRVLSKTISPILKQVPAAKEHVDTVELFGAFDISSFPHQEAWPSDLRNLINYRPGYFYAAGARKPFPTDIAKFIKKQGSLDWKALARQQTACTNECASLTIENEPLPFARLLFFRATALQLLCDVMFSELVKDYKLDSRGVLRRSNFLKKHGLPVNKLYWPVAA